MRASPVTPPSPGCAPAVQRRRGWTSELRIGDAVECLVPRNLKATKAFGGDQTYALGVCHVFGYLDADAVSLFLDPSVTSLLGR